MNKYIATHCLCIILMLLINETVSKIDNEMAPSYSERRFVFNQLRAFINCNMKSDITRSFDDSKAFCPITFDGWGCWDSTPGGQEAFIDCPDFLTGRNFSSGKASRNCLFEGKWETNISTGLDILNYTECTSDPTKSPSIFHLSIVLRLLIPGGDYNMLNNIDEEILENCVLNALLVSNTSIDGLYCPKTFDGWGCWKDTKAGEIAYTKCPPLFPNYKNKFGFKICNKDGTWFRHPDTNKTWSNYTTCSDLEDLAYRKLMNYCNVGAYALSTTVLIISLIIFCYFKTLKCTRITIHKHLFVSFILSNILWIIWYPTVAHDPEVYSKGEIGCQILHFVKLYFTVANYFWMFCEGLYLHTLLVVTFLSELKVLISLYIIGWGIPLILISIYAAVRSSYPEHTTNCWDEPSDFTWILEGPICVSLLLNAAFLINIIRVLVMKLRALNTPETQQTKKAVRATIILIPLLGLHYFIIPIRPKGKTWELIYEICSIFVTPLQGFYVAMLFCLLNSEVLCLLKKKWQQLKLMKGTIRKYSSNNTSYSTVTRATYDSPPCESKRKSIKPHQKRISKDSLNQPAGEFEVTLL